MDPPPDFQQAFQEARKLQAQGRLREAEQLYRQLTAPGEHRETVLRALVELYLQAHRPKEVIDTLVALTEEVPDSLYYYARLASLLDGLGHTDAAIGHYPRLLKRQPELRDRSGEHRPLLHAARTPDGALVGLSRREHLYRRLR